MSIVNNWYNHACTNMYNKLFLSPEQLNFNEHLSIRGTPKHRGTQGHNDKK